MNPKTLPTTSTIKNNLEAAKRILDPRGYHTVGHTYDRDIRQVAYGYIALAQENEQLRHELLEFKHGK